ncbi:MAG: hypothetical protein L0312_30690 [Acidobacteria bacterium]|nr:hypothetical protein [Acidobacteriota bacterium]
MAPLPEGVSRKRFNETKELEQLAADSEVIFADDTLVKILECIKEDKQKAKEEAAKKGKKGEKKEKPRATQTTGIVARNGEHQIAWYRSGRQHAGENVDELLTANAEVSLKPEARERTRPCENLLVTK